MASAQASEPPRRPRASSRPQPSAAAPRLYLTWRGSLGHARVRVGAAAAAVAAAPVAHPIWRHKRCASQGVPLGPPLCAPLVRWRRGLYGRSAAACAIHGQDENAFPAASGPPRLGAARCAAWSEDTGRYSSRAPVETPRAPPCRWTRPRSARPGERWQLAAKLGAGTGLGDGGPDGAGGGERLERRATAEIRP